MKQLIAEMTELLEMIASSTPHQDDTGVRL